jgi:thiamine biosynthesis protein ThiS
MQIKLNGVKKELLPETSIHGLLAQLHITSERVAIELNLTIIDKNQFDQILLKEGDHLEIINFVGGGAQGARPLGQPRRRRTASLGL